MAEVKKKKKKKVVKKKVTSRVNDCFYIFSKGTSRTITPKKKKMLVRSKLSPERLAGKILK